MQTLPNEVFINKICPYFTEIDLGRCCQVCTSWNSMASCDNAWRSLAANISYPQPTPEEGIRDFVKKEGCKKLHSDEEILNSIISFLAKNSLGINGKFYCIDANRNPLILLEIKGSSDPLVGEDCECTIIPAFEQKVMAINSISKHTLSDHSQTECEIEIPPHIRISELHDSKNKTDSPLLRNSVELNCYSSSHNFLGRVHFPSELSWSTRLFMNTKVLVSEKIIKFIEEDNKVKGP